MRSARDGQFPKRALHHDKGIQRSETEAEAAESGARSAEASGAEAEVEKVKNRRAT